jgi:hypothetical protein
MLVPRRDSYRLQPQPGGESTAANQLGMAPAAFAQNVQNAEKTL